jgi:LPS-assembly protein
VRSANFKITTAALLLGLGAGVTPAVVPVAHAQAKPQAQTPANAPASLVADSISINANGDLVATGNVEVFYDGAQLTARSIIYHSDKETLEITGPLRLTQGDDIFILADSAALDRDLQQGLLRGARMVMNQQLQLAAARIERVDGRYTQLYKTVASSCEVCATNPTPLWEIRAQSILHDQTEQQLYFEQAQLRVMGVPLLYLPHLRLPDPTLRRARGFLIPSAISDSNLGVGVRVPYFIPIGEDKDLTLAPRVTNKTNTIEFRYRQAYANGDLEFEGAVSDDSLRPGETRAYIFGGGTYELANDFTFKFRAEEVSDDDYLLAYDFTSRDLLNSYVDLSRVYHDEYMSATFSKARSLRDDDDNSTLPNLAFDATYERRFVPVGVGGTGAFSAELHSHQRSSDADMVGRDVQRGSLNLNWEKSTVVGSGLLFRGIADVGADFYGIQQDSTYPSNEITTNGTIGAELRLPMLKRSESGVRHLLEPIFQVFYSPASGDLPPNEDSQEAALDEGNLFSMSRFAGADRHETGAWTNVGLTYKRISPSGLSFGTTVGRVFRAQDPNLFNTGSGLEGYSSDWLAAIEVDLPNQLSLVSRSLIDDDFSFSRSETLISYDSDRFNVSTGHIWLPPEPAISRLTNTSEWTFDAAFKIDDTWSGDVRWRYDLYRNAAAEAGFGLTYSNECVDVDLSLSHRFTSSTNVEPSTSVGMTIGLSGFGRTNNGTQRAAKTCMR